MVKEAKESKEVYLLTDMHREWLVAFLKRCIETDKFPVETTVGTFATILYNTSLDRTDKFNTVRRICEIVAQLETMGK
jgi:hypothetical protein